MLPASYQECDPQQCFVCPNNVSLPGQLSVNNKSQKLCGGFLLNFAVAQSTNDLMSFVLLFKISLFSMNHSLALSKFTLATAQLLVSCSMLGHLDSSGLMTLWPHRIIEDIDRPVPVAELQKLIKQAYYFYFVQLLVFLLINLQCRPRTFYMFQDIIFKRPSI